MLGFSVVETLLKHLLKSHSHSESIVNSKRLETNLQLERVTFLVALLYLIRASLACVIKGLDIFSLVPF